MIGDQLGTFRNAAGLDTPSLIQSFRPYKGAYPEHFTHFATINSVSGNVELAVHSADVDLENGR